MLISRAGQEKGVEGFRKSLSRKDRLIRGCFCIRVKSGLFLALPLWGWLCDLRK